MNHRILAAVALAAALTGAADDDTEKPAPTAEHTALVAQCFIGCIEAYADRANNHHWGNHKCQWQRNAIVAARSCETGCSEIWRAAAQPPTKLRDRLRGWLDDDETDYDASPHCPSKYPRDGGVRLQY